MDAQEDDSVALSQSTFQILQQFLEEQKRAEQTTSEDPFAENWAMSQFWYTDDTAAQVAGCCCDAAREGSVACVACPSLFRKIRSDHPKQRSHLFEFDRRFEVLGDFSYYDYNEPLAIEDSLEHSFRVVVIDPPYLSSECLEKTITTMKALAEEVDPIFVALTGASMRGVARRLLDLRPVRWRPEHKNKLGNEFCLYTNSSELAAKLGGWDEELMSDG